MAVLVRTLNSLIRSIQIALHIMLWLPGISTSVILSITFPEYFLLFSRKKDL